MEPKISEHKTAHGDTYYQCDICSDISYGRGTIKHEHWCGDKHCIIILKEALNKSPKPFPSHQWHGSIQVFSDAYSAWYKFSREILTDNLKPKGT